MPVMSLLLSCPKPTSVVFLLSACLSISSIICITLFLYEANLFAFSLSHTGNLLRKELLFSVHCIKVFFSPFPISIFLKEQEARHGDM